MTTWALLEQLGDWQSRRGPLKVRLKAALIDLMLRGELRSGTRLPSERAFAKALAVSRNTVTGAYALLAEEGFAQPRRGSGSIVHFAYDNRALFAIRTREIDETYQLSRVSLERDDVIDFCVASVDLPQQFFGYTVFDPHELQTLGVRNAYDPRGMPELRAAIARDLHAKGLPTDSEQILITSGGQQAISLAASLFVQRGDTVALESPTFFIALDHFRTAGARLCALPWAPQATSVREALVHGNVRMLYVISTHQNPTGRVLTTSQRQMLAQVTGELGIPVVEDTTLEDLSYDCDTPPSIASFARERNIVIAGSLNKQFWSGLRIGWLRADETAITRFARLKTTTDLTTSLWSQAVALRVMEHIAQIRAFRQKDLKERMEFTTRLLQQHLPDWQYDLPRGGFSLWVRLPLTDARPFVQFARRFGVKIISGSAMTLDEAGKEHIRIVFTAPREYVAEGIRRLEQAWRAFGSRPLPQVDMSDVLVV